MKNTKLDRLALLAGGSLLALALVASPMTIEPGSLLPAQPEALAKDGNNGRGGANGNAGGRGAENGNGGNTASANGGNNGVGNGAGNEGATPGSRANERAVEKRSVNAD